MCCKHTYLRLLWDELHSGVYADTTTSSDEIFEKHGKLSAEVDCNRVNDHRYLYGIFKLHKPNVSLRWIAGSRIHSITNNVSVPACSMSGPEAVVGGILRLIMGTLKAKDDILQQEEGIKRYWVVTSVDEVARQLKGIPSNYTNNTPYTRDFTRMYTSLPQDKIANGVLKAVQEALTFQSSTYDIQPERLKFRFNIQRTGQVQASYTTGEGLTI